MSYILGRLLISLRISAMHIQGPFPFQSPCKGPHFAACLGSWGVSHSMRSRTALLAQHLMHWDLSPYPNSAPEVSPQSWAQGERDTSLQEQAGTGAQPICIPKTCALCAGGSAPLLSIRAWHTCALSTVTERHGSRAVIKHRIRREPFPSSPPAYSLLLSLFLVESFSYKWYLCNLARML